MDKRELFLGISFADSEYEFFKMSENSVLTIHMLSWQAKPFQVVFSNTIQFLYRLGDFPKDLYEMLGDSIFLQEALSREYVHIPTDHPFKLFQMEDIYDFPFIQIVAESVNIIKE